MATPRVYATAALRQAAYRERLKAKRASVTVLEAPLRIEAPGGARLLEVTLDEGRPTLRLFDGQGAVAVQLTACPEGGELAAYGSEGKGAAFVYADASGGHVQLQDVDEQVILDLPQPSRDG